MRLPTFSSLLCLAGLISLPVSAFEGDPNIKSIPVCALCGLFTTNTEILTMAPIAPNPQSFSGMNGPLLLLLLLLSTEEKLSRTNDLLDVLLTHATAISRFRFPKPLVRLRRGYRGPR